MVRKEKDTNPTVLKGSVCLKENPAHCHICTHLDSQCPEEEVSDGSSEAKELHSLQKHPA